MKLSISLSDDELAELDRYITDHGLTSRSAGIQRAIRLLRHPELEQDYAAAFAEWKDDGGAEWDAVSADGMDDATR